MNDLKKPRSYATISGISLERVYDQSRLSSDLNDRLGNPGSFPFTRGIHAGMYRDRLWTMRQYAGFGTAKEANERYRYLLSQGVTGLSVAFDLPTQMGRDSDHALAHGEVGRVGVAIASIEDMRELLANIDLSEVSVSMTINATAAILLALLLVVAEEQGVPWTALRGTVQNDVLKEYIARGTYIYPPRQALRIVTDIFEFCAAEVPQWNTISVSGYHIREAGSTAPEEVAFTLANGITYVQAALDRGLKVDDFATRMAFFFNCHNDFLEEIAKFRAARRMWAGIMRDRFGSKDPKAQMLRFHTQTAGSSLTAQQPHNNIVRTTIQALAAVLGGTQSLHTNAFDEALGLPTEESARLALRTQQVIAHESGISNVVDPLGGSYCIEALTNSVEAEAMKRLEHIEKLGGMLTAIEEQYPQGEIERSAYRYQQQVETGEQIVVGVNQYKDSFGGEVELQRLNAQGEKTQVKRLTALRKKRDATAWKNKLEALNSAAKNNTNVMPHIIAAVRANATVGEISDTLRSVFGEYEGM